MYLAEISKKGEDKNSSRQKSFGSNSMRCFESCLTYSLRFFPALDSVYTDHLLRKPHHCSVCLRGFATKQNLKVHFRTHTGERPYGCSICGRRFNQKHVLRDHERTHTGDMPYHCDICIQRFKTSSALYIHNRSYHPQRISQRHGY